MPTDAVGRTNLGLVYIAQSKFREAVNALGEAIRIDPSAADAYQFLGCAYFRLGEEERAFEAFQSAVKLQSENADSRYLLGFVSMSLGKRDRAIEQYKALESLDSALAEKLHELIYEDKSSASIRRDVHADIFGRQNFNRSLQRRCARTYRAISTRFSKFFLARI